MPRFATAAPSLLMDATIRYKRYVMHPVKKIQYTSEGIRIWTLLCEPFGALLSFKEDLVWVLTLGSNFVVWWCQTTRHRIGWELGCPNPNQLSESKTQGVQYEYQLYVQLPNVSEPSWVHVLFCLKGSSRKHARNEHGMGSFRNYTFRRSHLSWWHALQACQWLGIFAQDFSIQYQIWKISKLICL